MGNNSIVDVFNWGKPDFNNVAIPNEIIDLAINKYLYSYNTAPEVALMFNICTWTLLKYVKLRGFKKENKYIYKSRCNHPSDQDIQKCVDEYVFSKMSLTKLANKYSVSYGAVRKWVMDSGNRLRTSSEAKMDKVKIKKAVKEYINGATTKQLSIKYKVDRATISDWLVMEGIKPQTYSERLGITQEMRDSAISLYVNDKLNCVEIAKIYKVSPSSVFYWTRDERRPTSEIYAIKSARGELKDRGRRANKGKVNTRFGEIYFDSSYEKDRLIQLNNDSSVVVLKRCPFVVPFVKNDKKSFYNPDLYIEYADGKKVVEEIKPLIRIKEIENRNKIIAAKIFFSNKDIIFKVTTEFKIYGRESKVYQKYIRFIAKAKREGRWIFGRTAERADCIA